MKAYLRAFDLWEVVETGRDPPPLRVDPMLAQIKYYSEECAKKYKALFYLHQAVSDVIFTRIMSCETAKEAWDKLKEEFHGSDKTRQMQILNLRRDIEVLRMKDSESVKEYSDGLMKTINQIRLLRDDAKEYDSISVDGSVISVDALKRKIFEYVESEDSKIKALVNTPALDWQLEGSIGVGSRTQGLNGRGCGRMDGHSFGGLWKKTPPEGYICHRCKVPGHFIQYCPTNGDPNYDFKRVRPPTGIPKSMLVPNPDGSYVLSSSATAVLQPNDDAFKKEIFGCFPSKRSWSVSDLPPELLCPLCKQVMKDAVLTSKCCFKSFCDKCIRDHLIISKLKCVCGAANVLADSLIPNMTLRDTINCFGV
ncbi:hypothetical protein GH714_028401 [Hevea brasiliensis]|uniref:Zinc knuckle CX2CX3GHX4C domain-containing protein n=1 Tax=Hevea brasiliensis TaxID=3981 RepID=A0A6A6LUK3_HEVBR|nr:hypothetical protein GH714_028401 [Hevea brasiliensis]